VPGKTFPPLLDQIMERALAKRSEDRYASAAEFGAALQHVLQGATQLPPHLMQAPSLDAPTSPQSFKPAPIPGQAGGLPALPQGISPPPAAVAVNTPTPGAPVAVRPAPPSEVRARVAKANVGLLVGVAVGFLLLGVGLALALSKLMSH
jgi:serine/threonine-protein kinase